MRKTQRSRLITWMEVAVLLSAVVSAAALVAKERLLLLLGIIPLFFIVRSAIGLKKASPQDAVPYGAIFGAFAVMILVVPFVFDALLSGMTGNPFDMMKYVFFGVFGFMIIFVVLRALGSGRDLFGRVLLADRELAVVEMEYDLLSGVNAGRYVIENDGAKKGQQVRIGVESGLFKKTKPAKVKEVL